MASETDPPTETDLVENVKFSAYLVVQYGEVYAPIFERLETELADLRRRRSPRDRARLALEAYTLDGALKAIR